MPPEPKASNQIRRPQKGVAPSRQRPAAWALAEIALIKSGLSRAEIACRCGISVGRLRNWFSDGCPANLTGAKFEAGLAYRYPVVTDARTLQLRARCFKALGVDPGLVRRPVLITWLNQLGVTGFARRDHGHRLFHLFATTIATRPDALNDLKSHENPAHQTID